MWSNSNDIKPWESYSTPPGFLSEEEKEKKKNESKKKAESDRLFRQIAAICLGVFAVYCIGKFLELDWLYPLYIGILAFFLVLRVFFSMLIGSVFEIVDLYGGFLVTSETASKSASNCSGTHW